MDLYGDEILTLREAASLLKTSVSNLKKMIYAGKIIASKVGWQWRVKRSEIATFLDINTPKSAK
jgi:excisionase family DNA binding protein